MVSHSVTWAAMVSRRMKLCARPLRGSIPTKSGTAPKPERIANNVVAFYARPETSERREWKGLNMSDENDVQIATIARHLRGLGLTEEQIQTHLAPLRPKQASPNPPPRKLVGSSIPRTSLFRPMRKGFSAGA